MAFEGSSRALLTSGQAIRFTPVSSLWTPGGEHKVDRPDPASGTPGAPGEPSGSGDRSAPGRSGRGASRPPNEAEPPDEAELDEVRRQLLDAPVEVVVANHAYGMFELAALHLSAQPPNLEKARLAVDALGALVEGLAGRLGNVEHALDGGPGTDQARLRPDQRVRRLRRPTIGLSGLAPACRSRGKPTHPRLSALSSPASSCSSGASDP